MVFGYMIEVNTGFTMPGHFVHWGESGADQEIHVNLPEAVPLTCPEQEVPLLEELPFPKVSVRTRPLSWLDSWPAECGDMGVYTVSVLEDDGQMHTLPFGVLCGSVPRHNYRPQFGYQLPMGKGAEGVSVRLDYHHPIPWDRDMERAVKTHRTNAGPAACVVPLQLSAKAGGSSLPRPRGHTKRPSPGSVVALEFAQEIPAALDAGACQLSLFTSSANAEPTEAACCVWASSR